MFEHIQVPSFGKPITVSSTGELVVPDTPVIAYIEGDGIGPEIWRAARPVIDAALAKESDMRIEWVELLAG